VIRVVRGSCVARLLPWLVLLPVWAVWTAKEPGLFSQPARAAELDSPDAAPASAPDTEQAPQPAAGNPGVASSEPQQLEPTSPPAIGELPWEVRPYRVLIRLSCAPGNGLDPAFCATLGDRLQRRLDGLVRPFWITEVAAQGPFFGATAEAFVRRMTQARAAPQTSSDELTSSAHDKTLCLFLSGGSAHGLQIDGCEWDGSLQQWSPLLTRTVNDPRDTLDVTLELVMDLFRPLARIDLTEGPSAELRIRGGELLAPESLPVMFAPGDLVVPYFRYLDRDRQVRQIQMAPLTFLNVVELVRSRMTCTVESAFSTALAGSRRRVELVAIRSKPRFAGTRLRLAPRTNPDRPLVGVRVRVYDRLPDPESPEPPALELMTDRFGNVDIPATREHPLRRLIVYSGGVVIASVPYLPGLEPESFLVLPDDEPRLEVEGNLAIVQGELIDLVARRTVMLARAVSLAKQQEWEQSSAVMRQIEEQPTIASFESRILAIRVPAVEQAQRNQDRGAVRRIEQMCRELEALASRYLARERIKVTQEEIDELKKLYARPQSRPQT
jgi:hypothetical protein